MPARLWRHDHVVGIHKTGETLMWSPFIMKEGVDGYKMISTAKTYRIAVIMCSVISVFIYIYSFYGSSKYSLGVNDTTGLYYAF